MKEFWHMTKTDVKNCLAKTTWCKANYEYFRGGGFSSHYVLEEEMPLTMIRVNLVNGIGPTIQLIEGYSCKIDNEIHEVLDQRTDKTWPTIWFAPSQKDKTLSVYDVMNNWGANHCVSIYGHIGEELITLASMLRIPVTFHNIEKNRIFRPHSFSLFGTHDLEAADVKACTFYGPLYK